MVLKTVILLNVFLQTIFFIFYFFDGKKQPLFEIEIFVNIIKVFTVTFDQFNAYLLNQLISYKKNQNILLTPNF